MAEAQYLPSNVDPVGSFFNAYQNTTNLMDTAQRRRWAMEDRARQQQQIDALEPIVQAENKARFAKANAYLAAAKQDIELQQRFAQEAPAARKEFEDAMALRTDRDRVEALGTALQKYRWMGLVPEGQAFISGLDANHKVMQHNLDIEDIRNYEREKMKQKRKADADLIAQRGEEERKTNASKRTPQMILIEARQAAQDAGDLESVMAYDSILKKASYIKPEAAPKKTKSDELEDALAKEKFYRDQGNDEWADTFKELAKKLSTKSESGVAVLNIPGLTASPTPTPTPKQNTAQSPESANQKKPTDLSKFKF